MKNLNVYLTFDGTCEAALNFYRDCFGGEIVSMQRFGDVPGGDMPPGSEQRVMHAEFRAENVYLMASDGMPDQPPSAGTNTWLSVGLEDKAEQHDIFAKLSAGGQVVMALEETFWGAEFGMLTDRYGINWMFNRELKS